MALWNSVTCFFAILYVQCDQKANTYTNCYIWCYKLNVTVIGCVPYGDKMFGWSVNGASGRLIIMTEVFICANYNDLYIKISTSGIKCVVLSNSNWMIYAKNFSYTLHKSMSY